MKKTSVLLKQVLTKPYNESQVSQIKSRLKDLENRKLSKIFGAVDKANLCWATANPYKLA